MEVYGGNFDRNHLMLAISKKNIMVKNGFRMHLSRIVLYLVLSFLSLPLLANTNVEYPVKAGFIYNFIAFTDWPTQTDAINFCIHGKDFFQDSIDLLQHKTSNKGKIRVLRLDNETELEKCQAVFISRNVIESLSNILKRLKHKPILTIADSPDAASQGVMINMKVKNEQIVFEINLASTKASGLQISSKVLSLAVQIYQ